MLYGFIKFILSLPIYLMRVQRVQSITTAYFIVINLNLVLKLAVANFPQFSNRSDFRRPLGLFQYAKMRFCKKIRLTQICGGKPST